MTQEKIIEKACDLFTKYGVKVVTINRIVSELHTSKRTIYKFFKDKDELLMACIRLYHQKIKSENEVLMHNAPNAIAAMAFLLKKILERHYTINSNFYADIYRFHPHLEPFLEEVGSYAHEEMLYLANWGSQRSLHTKRLEIIRKTRATFQGFDLKTE